MTTGCIPEKSPEYRTSLITTPISAHNVSPANASVTLQEKVHSQASTQNPNQEDERKSNMSTRIITLGSKNTRMAPKTHTTYVRISTQRMDTLHTIRWGGGDSTKKQCGKNSSIQRSSSALAYVFGITIPRTPFLNRLFCIEIFIFETRNHP